MPAFTYRTLGDLRASLRARLGFGATGAATGASDEIINGFLLSAFHHVYWMQDWRKLIAYYDTTIGATQNLIDYPPDANPHRLWTPKDSSSPIWVQVNGTWIPAKEGISAAAWDTMDDNNSYPMRYELFDQIQFWPKSNAVYNLKIWYVKNMTRFTQDNDRPNVDDNLIFLHALVAAKSHYKQADAAMYTAQWTEMVAKVSGRQFGSNNVIRRDNPDNDPIPRPVVV
jgi:hypothetical protein